MASVREAHLKVNKEQAKELTEEVEKLEGELEASEKRMEEAEKVEDAMYEDFQRDIKRQLDEKMNAARGEAAAGVGMDQLQNRLYETHMDDSTTFIKLRQNDVMRMNKVIREVSRCIATGWQSVFAYLMAAQLSKPQIKDLVAKIEKQNRPLMQAYKALNVWKDTKSEDLSLSQLADALRINKKIDLANYVFDAIECEGDDFLKLQAPVEDPEEAADAEGGDEDAKKPTLKKATPRSGVLDDRKFLQIAKKIGTEWEKVATTLGLAEEDIKEILEGEGATYQGAFKMLWTWRDRTVELDQDNAQILQEALKASGKEEVAELI